MSFKVDQSLAFPDVYATSIFYNNVVVRRHYDTTLEALVSHRTLVQARISSVVGRVGRGWEFWKGTSTGFHIVNRARADAGNIGIWMIV